MYKTPSRWFANKQQYARKLQGDVEIRKMIRLKFRDGGVARVEIDRSSAEITIVVYTSKPGVIIGRGGAQIEDLKKEIKQQFFGSEKMKVSINIQEVRDPDLNADLIYQNVRDQIEARVPFRRAMKRAMESVTRAGALGAKITIAGRLNGADIARTETVTYGRLPLQILRANIDYSRGVAHTIYGVIGIKVWVYKGDVFGDEEEQPQEKKRKRRSSQPRQPRKKKIDTGGKKTILRKKKDVVPEVKAPTDAVKKPAEKINSADTK